VVENEVHLLKWVACNS